MLASGGGGLYQIDPGSGSYGGALGKADEWQNATALTRLDTMLYIVCGGLGGCRGSGGLSTCSLYVAPFWLVRGAAFACAHPSSFMACSGLYQVNPGNGSYKKLGGDNWKNETVMTSCDGSLYIVCGRMGGCRGAGGL